MKKVLSMLLVLTMLLSVSAVGTFAADNSEANALELVINELGAVPPSTTFSELSLDNEITLDGVPTAKWLTTGLSSNQISFPLDADFATYDTLHLQLYSPKATDDRIGIKFDDATHYGTVAVVVDWEGWKTVDIPLANFTNLDKYTIKNFQIWDQGWNYNYGDNQADSDKNGSLNIGKIWCTDESRIDIFDSDVSGVSTLRLANTTHIRFDVTDTVVNSALPKYLVVEASLDNNYLVRFHALTHVKDAETLEKRAHMYFIKTDESFCHNGKNVVVIPTSELVISGGEADNYLVTDLLNDVEIYFNGWGFEDYDSGDVIRFEKIYFTDNPNVIPETAVFTNGDTLIDSRCVLDYDNTLYGKPTNKWNFTGDNNIYKQISLGNLSAYNTLNVMLYSEKAVTDTIGIHITDNNGNKLGKPITVDWVGWKRVEIPLSNYSGLNKADIRRMDFINAGWSYGWNPANGKVGNLNFMNIGKVWFSKNQANLPMEHVVRDPEFDVNFVGLINQNLVGVGSLSFDFYCPEATDNTYATVVFNNGKSNVQSEPIYLNFEGWKTMTVKLKDVSKVENATIYFSADWNLGLKGYVPSTRDYGNKAKNVKAIYATKDCGEACVSYVTESGYVSDDVYVATDVSDIAFVNAVVTEKESGSIVEANVVASSNSIEINFEKEAGKTYNINLDSIVDSTYNKYNYGFDYEVKEASEGFNVEANEIIVSTGNVKASFDYTNFGGNTEDATVVIAVYDALGKKLEVLRTVNYSQLHSGRAGELYAELGGNYMSKTVKAFVLDSFESVRPLCTVNE